MISAVWSIQFLLGQGIFCLHIPSFWPCGLERRCIPAPIGSSGHVCLPTFYPHSLSSQPNIDVLQTQDAILPLIRMWFRSCVSAHGGIKRVLSIVESTHPASLMVASPQPQHPEPYHTWDSCSKQVLREVFLKGLWRRGQLVFIIYLLTCIKVSGWSFVISVLQRVSLQSLTLQQIVL